MSDDTLRYRGRFVNLDPDKKSDIAEGWLKHARKFVAGQPRLLDVVAQGLEKAYSVLRNPQKPIICVLTLGPSGVGKTLIPKVLADYLFEDPKGFTRVDGQDFSKPHDVARLTGAPPGYIGYGDEPLFTQEKLDKPAFNAVWRKFLSNLSPDNKRKLMDLNRKLYAQQNLLKSIGGSFMADAGYRQQVEEEIRTVQKQMLDMGYPRYVPGDDYFSVILFDEIGRADRALHNLLFKILDEGEIATAKGGTTNFTNTFLFLTDNVGSEEIADTLRKGSGSMVEMGFHSAKDTGLPEQDQEIYKLTMRAARKVFETPFLSRMSHIVVARPLRKKDLYRVLEIQMRELHTALAKEKFPIVVTLDADVRRFLVKEALDKPEENARLLIKKLDSRIIRKLERLAHTKQIEPGDYIAVRLRSSGSSRLLFQKLPRGGEGSKELIIPSDT